MNKTEYLLTCLTEECSEVQKECTKAMRFGLDDNWKERGKQSERIMHEFVDLMAVYESLVEEGCLEAYSTQDLYIMVQNKKERLEKYMNYARERGTLVD